MKSIIYFFLTISVLISSCGTGVKETKNGEDENTSVSDSIAKGAVAYVDLSDPLEQDLIIEGKSIYDAQCSKCHYLDTATLEGPGWAGITNRRDPNWIMNMILNVDLMLEVDSLAHSLLENADIKMPDQRLSVDKSRSVLEYMRMNDMEKTGEKDAGLEGE